MLVYLLLVNARTENEGVHSLLLGNRNVVLMFEDPDDATRYAMLLEAQDFNDVSVEAVDTEEIDMEHFDYEWQLVPKGFIPKGGHDRYWLSPPETNVKEGEWSEQEKPSTSSASPSPSAPPSNAPTEEGEMSALELEAIRRKLEGLL